MYIDKKFQDPTNNFCLNDEIITYENINVYK